MAFRDKLKEQLTLIEAAQNSKKPGLIYIGLGVSSIKVSI